MTNWIIWLLPLPPIAGFFCDHPVHQSRTRPSATASRSARRCFPGWAAWSFSSPPLGRRIWASTVFEFGDQLAADRRTWLQIGVRVDPLSAVVLFFVAWTVLMIFIYSIGYHNFGQPKGDHDHARPAAARRNRHRTRPYASGSVRSSRCTARFFAFISLFAFGMYTLVVSDNLLTLFVGWEIMGLVFVPADRFLVRQEIGPGCSHQSLYDHPHRRCVHAAGHRLRSIRPPVRSPIKRYFPAADAASAWPAHRLSSGLSAAGLIGLLLFIGTVGKSAQWPLHVWLPDAMEGPTPVSAMIHAATMVSAGVYMVIRIFPLLQPGCRTLRMTVVAFIGAFTALFAATIAVAQNDIKKVLAYSTISQLGFHDRRAGRGRLCGGGFPPGDACLLQGAALPGFRFGHPWHGAWRAAYRRARRPAGYVQHGRPAQEDADHFLDFPDRRFCPFGFPGADGGFLVEG